MIIKRIDAFSCGKVLGTLYAAMGLLFGGVLSLISVLGAAINNANGNGGFGPAIFGAGAVIALPLFYGVGGFVGGIISAALYNVVASFVGGIEVDFEE